MYSAVYSSELEFNVPFQHKHGYIRDEEQAQTGHHMLGIQPGLTLSSKYSFHTFAFYSYVQLCQLS